MKTKSHPDFHQLKLSAVAVAIAGVVVGFTGCGGSEEALGLSGKVVDGYVSGAKLFADKDNNGSCETDTGVSTNGTGDFTLPASFNGFTICAKGGTDIGTGKLFVGELKAPAGATQITPLSTLVLAVIEADKAAGKTTTAASAAAKVATNLNLGNIDVLNTDPVALSTSNPKLLQTNVAIQTLMVEAANNVAKAATGQTATSVQTTALYSSAASGVAKAVAAATTPVDLTTTQNPTGFSSFVSKAIENTVTVVQTSPNAAKEVVGVANLVAMQVASDAASTVSANVLVAGTTIPTTPSTTAAVTTTTAASTTTTAATTTTTKAATTTTAAPTTTTAAATTTTTKAATTTTVAPTTTTAAATTTTTKAATTTTVAPTTTTAAATTTTTKAATTTTAAPTTTTAAATTTTTKAATTTTTTAAPTTTTTTVVTTTTTTVPATGTPINLASALTTPFDSKAGIGINDASGAANYTGTAIQFGPYSVSGLTAAASVTVPANAGLQTYTSFAVNNGAFGTTATNANVGDSISVKFDLAGYIANFNGGPVLYSTDLRPKIKVGTVTVTLSVLMCGDPTLPPGVGNSVCK